MEGFNKYFNKELFDKYFVQLMVVLAIIFVAIVTERILRYLIHRYFRRTSLSSKLDPTKYAFSKNAVSAIIYLGATIAIFYVIPPLRSLGVTLFASAGIFAAILGFASQAAFSNIISGIFIVIFKPFRVEDIITIGSTYSGVVEDITLRHTVIRNFENRRVIIPNSIISNDVILNSSIVEEKVCVFMEMGISYDSDIDLALSIMREEAMAHPTCIDARDEEQLANNDPQVRTAVIGFGDSSVNLRAWVWAPSQPDGFQMKCDLFKSIKGRFDKAGIEIPFPYRTIVYKQDKPSQDATPTS